MGLGLTIVMLVASWLAVACAMLWGVLRISRRHQPRAPRSAPPSDPLLRRRHNKRRSAGAH